MCDRTRYASDVEAIASPIPLHSYNKSDRPYERMNITGVKGLTEAEIGTLKALGAMEHGEM